eukprot:scaffold86921_cov50-Prasinocladus_malaysianus.AAC.4
MIMRILSFTCLLLCKYDTKERKGAAKSGVVATAVHPGIVNTNLIRYITPPGILQARQDDLESSLKVGKFLARHYSQLVEALQGCLVPFAVVR